MSAALRALELSAGAPADEAVSVTVTVCPAYDDAIMVPISFLSDDADSLMT